MWRRWSRRRYYLGLYAVESQTLHHLVWNSFRTREAARAWIDAHPTSDLTQWRIVDAKGDVIE